MATSITQLIEESVADARLK